LFFFLALQKFTINEESNSMKSATTQVYLNLGKLIKLCDEVILSDDAQSCACLNEENVKEIVDLVENAVEVT
jgi:Rap guanine nucleotide exchange factor 1